MRKVDMLMKAILMISACMLAYATGRAWVSLVCGSLGLVDGTLWAAGFAIGMFFQYFIVFAVPMAYLAGRYVAWHRRGV